MSCVSSPTHRSNIIYFLIILTISFFEISNSQQILIRNVDFKISQFDRHKTRQFYGATDGLSHVIIRRGDTFDFRVELSNKQKGISIEVTLEFVTKFDKMTISLPKQDHQNGWRLQQSVNGQNIDATINIPGNAPVGIWAMEIAVINSAGHVIERMNVPNKIIILFNPWSQNDPAYFPEQHKLSEYVMNERGYIYSYNYVRARGRPWVFGQFQPEVLDAILFVLDKARLPASHRGDITRVTRELTNLMNDDRRNYRGVLYGKWQEPYGPFEGRPSKKPWEWTGSPAIFLEYYKSNGKPVGYGQCWVFGGILTTAFRALGIASRPVSNLISAHSNWRDLTIETYVDDNNNVRHREMIWNFHVWTQAWFRRDDLNDVGWQELDGTPQETNDGKYQVGPASLANIRNSNLRTRFDTAFLYEEVNADSVTFGPRGQILEVERDRVGKAVLTKAIGSDDPEDITDLYKPRENTEAERESYRRAAQSLGIRPPSLRISGRSLTKNVIITINTKNGINIGSPVPVEIKISNPSYSSKQLQVTIYATALYYNGIEAALVKRHTQSIGVTAGKATSIPFHISASDYYGKLHDVYTMRIEVVAKQGDTYSFEKKYISLESPELKITAPKSVFVNQAYKVKMEVRNPYNRVLNGGYIAYEGTRIHRISLRIPDIPAYESTTVTLTLKSYFAQKETVVFQFYSETLHMSQSADINVIGQSRYNFASYTLRQKTFNGHPVLIHWPTNTEGARIIEKKDFDCCKLQRIK